MEGLESESIMTGTSYHDDLSNVDETGDYTIVEGGTSSAPYIPEGVSADADGHQVTLLYVDFYNMQSY